MRSTNSCPEANVFASIPRERTSRLMARQTDSSSSTMAISGLDLLKASVLLSQAQQRTEDLRRLKETRPILLSVRRVSNRLFTNLLPDQFRAVQEACILDLSPIVWGMTLGWVFRFRARPKTPVVNATTC